MVKYFKTEKNLKPYILHVSGGIEPPNILAFPGKSKFKKKTYLTLFFLFIYKRFGENKQNL